LELQIQGFINFKYLLHAGDYRIMIDIIPSIWLSHGKCVRIQEGDFSKGEVYQKSPMDFAKDFEDHGIKTLHLVDLDGATRGTPSNYHVLETLAAHTSLKIDFAGGIRTDGDISKAFEYGATYITAASISIIQPDLFAEWVLSYGREKVTLAADAKHGQVYWEGWQKKSEIDLFEHINFFYTRGLKYVKTTEISKDGKLEGPDFDLYQRILDKFPGIGLLASGGVRNIDDIEKLNDMGVFGVIFGTAYYGERIKLTELERFLVAHS
jgi:phosphoribosylformimino-5-aminoimidazole carboxamide ribotide isomerase